MQNRLHVLDSAVGLFHDVINNALKLDLRVSFFQDGFDKHCDSSVKYACFMLLYSSSHAERRFHGPMVYGSRLVDSTVDRDDGLHEDIKIDCRDKILVHFDSDSGVGSGFINLIVMFLEVMSRKPHFCKKGKSPT